MLLYKMLQYKKFWIFFLYSLFLHPVAPWPKNEVYKNAIRQLINVIKRRSTFTSNEKMMYKPNSENLREYEFFYPDLMLLPPTSGALKSSVKYPQKDTDGSVVYGNLNNLGITNGQTKNRVLYTGFRKVNNLWELLRPFFEKFKMKRQKSNIYKMYIPESVEDLPKAEPLHPGHSLLPPSSGSLKSSVKYPQKDTDGSAVYGNLNNLGITYGKTKNRVLYTGFRKANDVLIKLLTEIYRKSHIHPKKRTNNMVVIEIEPSLVRNINNRDADDLAEVKYKNNGMEILDDASNEGSSYHQTRRRRKQRRSKFRDRLIRDKESSSDTDSTSSDASTDYEKNPGNPYTIHKDKYKQNWLWNHFMDGNHMNVNPYAPPFNSMGPSGAALFFGRKWWYFNQDDFKPLN